MNNFFQTLKIQMIRTKNWVRRTISIFAAPLALVTVGAVLQVYAAAIHVAETLPPDDRTGPVEFLKLSLSVTKHRLLGG
jgi:hypothetical protein